MSPSWLNSSHCYPFGCLQVPMCPCVWVVGAMLGCASHCSPSAMGPRAEPLWFDLCRKHHQTLEGRAAAPGAHTGSSACSFPHTVPALVLPTQPEATSWAGWGLQGHRGSAGPHSRHRTAVCSGSRWHGLLGGQAPPMD